MALIESLLPLAREKLVTIRESSPLMDAAKLLRPGTDIVVVCDLAGRIAGVITKSDVVARLGHCQGASCLVMASAVMTREVIACYPTDWVSDAWSAMKRHRLKNMPIIDDNKTPLGMLNARDALQALLSEVEDEEALLRDYVMTVGYQ